MIVAHELPAGWVDTGETDRIQPSAVAGLSHVVTLEPEDLETLRGPAGADGAPGPAGPVTKSVLPAGLIAPWRRKVAPPGWLAMVGEGVLVADYPELVAAVYVGDADNATAEGCYRCNAANGTGRNVAGAYLFIEDVRGDFVRALDAGRGVDVGRVLGSSQLDAMQGHSHTLGPLWQAGASGAPGGGAVGSIGLYTGVSDPTATSFGVPRLSRENRPRNRAYLMCISTGKAI